MLQSYTNIVLKFGKCNSLSKFFACILIGFATKKVGRSKNTLDDYPFGLKHEGYNYVVQGDEHTYKTFQGQERTDDFDLNVYEWRYRVSDPAIGRFWQIDPLAEDYEWMTTYQFSSNQPIHAPELEGLESMYDLNTRDINLNGANKEEMAAFNKAQTKAFVIGAAVTVDVLVTKGALTKSLLKQTVVNTAINGAGQLLSGKDFNFNKAVGDALGNADLFDAGMDALTSELPGGNLTENIVGSFATSMVDATNDKGLQIGGVNKEMASVATDLAFSAATSNIKNANIPNVKFSGTSLGKSIKNGVIDVFSGGSKNSLTSPDTKPAVGSRNLTQTSERYLNTKVRDNTRVRQR